MSLTERSMPNLQWHRSLEIDRKNYLLQSQIPRRITIHTSIRPVSNSNNNQWRNNNWNYYYNDSFQRSQIINYGNKQPSVIENWSLNAFRQPVPEWSNRTNSIGDIRDVINRKKRHERRCGGYDWCCSSLCASLWLFVFLLIALGIAALIVALLVKSNMTSTITSTSTSITTTTTTSATTTTTTAPYCSTRVTFDDISGQSATSGVIPNGYNNLNWTNAEYLNASTMPTSGYQTALNSPPYVAYNPGENPITKTTANGTRFAFDSMTVAPAWRDNMIWYIYGYRAGTLAVYGSYVQQAFNKTTLSCSTCSDLDTLYFTSSGGIPHSGLADNGTEFAFDDLCISFGY